MTYARPFASMVCNTRDIATAKQQVISDIGNPIVEVIVAQGDERQECLVCMLCHTDPKFWFNLVGGIRIICLSLVIDCYSAQNLYVVLKQACQFPILL